MDKKADLPVPKLCFERIPVPCSPSCVDNRPIDKSNGMAKDLENGVLVPIHAGIIPHAVEVRDVVCEGGGRRRRDILGSKCDRVTISKLQCPCPSLVACHAWARVDVGGYGSQEAVGWQQLRCSTGYCIARKWWTLRWRHNRSVKRRYMWRKRLKVGGNSCQECVKLGVHILQRQRWWCSDHAWGRRGSN